MKRLMTVLAIGLIPMACYETEEPEHRQSELIYGTVDHASLMSFDDDAQYKIGTRYGKAAARMSNGIGSSRFCSAFLIDDDIIATAHHCRAFLSVTNTADFEFGRWGLRTSGAWTESNAWARQRLVSLGMSDAAANAASLNTLRNWNCTLIGQENNRDVDFWRCTRKVIGYTYNGRFNSYGLLPGMVWGHFNVESQTKTTNDPVYVVGINQASQFTSLQQALLSPNGQVQNGNATCYNGSSYQNCFWFDGADTRCGHSGGAMLDENNHAAFGVFSGFNWSNSAIENGCSWNSYSTGQTNNINIGAYFGAQAVNYATQQPSTYLTGAPRGYTHWVGQTRTSPSRWLWSGQCPPNTMAAGLIGHTMDYTAQPNLHNRLGNLGLICMPHTSPTNLHYDRGVVVSPNTLQVSHVPTPGMDFNTYRNERYTYNFTTRQRVEQDVTMCPPGYFIKGLSLRHDTNGIGKITSLHCQDPQTGHSGYTYPGGKLGDYHSTYTGTHQCPSGAYVTGIDVARMWVIEGFSTFCTNED